MQILIRYALLDKGLNTIVLGGVLSLKLLDVEHVVPDTVISSVVIDEAICTSFELMDLLIRV